MLTINDVQRALPVQLRLNATQDLVDKINSVTADEFVAQNVRENFLTYSTVLREGKFKTEDYLSAIQYVTYKMMGLTNKDSYAKAFPDRYAILVGRGASDKDISAYVAAYHSNKLVNLILEQALIPCWLLNQGAYQKAINKQLELMDSANSEKVQTDAANSLLTHLKRPETQKVELDLNIKEASGMAELRATMLDLAHRQLEQIKGGTRAKAIAHEPLIVDADYQEIV